MVVLELVLDQVVVVVEEMPWQWYLGVLEVVLLELLLDVVVVVVLEQVETVVVVVQVVV